MTISEALVQGGQTALIGLSTVFSVLIILMIIIHIMKLVFYKDGAKQKKIEEVKAPLEVKEEIKEVEDEDELIAVLTAAVAASLNTSTYNLQIKSYRRTDSSAPAWNRAGLRETIDNRF